jgi:putative endonuclease
MKMRLPVVYMMASKRNGTIYTGVSSDLIKRVYEHKNAIAAGFTVKYNCKLLVFYEFHDTMINAITREKQIKAGSRIKKMQLIEAMNPEWNDLYDDLFD